MITGISTASLFLKQPTEDAILSIKNLGADCAEVFFSTFYEYRPEFAKSIKPLIGDFNVNSVHTLTTNFEHQLLNSSRRVRGDGFYWLDQVLNSAKILNCKYYTFHGLYRLRGMADNFDRMGEYFREICNFCARFGVTLCLENVEWSTYNRPGVFRELKSRCPDLMGTFDIKQARRSGYPYQMYIEEMAGSIAHVHLSDVDGDGRVRLPGEGSYNFEEIIKRLKGAGFNGAVIIEVYPDSFADLSALSRSINYLNEIIYKT